MQNSFAPPDAGGRCDKIKLKQTSVKLPVPGSVCAEVHAAQRYTGIIEVGISFVCLDMVKLSAELIEQAAQYTNPVRDRELDLRGWYFFSAYIPVFECV